MLAVCAVAFIGSAVAQRNTVLDPEFRDRYQEALRRSPFQDRAFDALFSSYFGSDGLDVWIAELEMPDDRAETHTAELILLGRIHARLFQAEKAIGYLEQVESAASNDPKFNLLLGTLYENEGRREEAIARLNAALEGLTEPEERANAARLLGDVLIRAGRVDEAAATWNRVAEGSDDLYALLALAEIYEGHQQWAEAIEVHDRIVAASSDNPYRQCRELRAIGDLELRQERYSEAVAAYERALDLVTPGNWLFADLKQRLIQAYEAWDNLPTFADYLAARVEADPSDVEFCVLLAETQQRLGRLEIAESTLLDALERSPNHLRASEALIAIYTAGDRSDDVQRTLAVLVESFPHETDYRRRLGEAYYREGDLERAIESWRGLIHENSNASRHVLLAGWFERYGFVDEAITAYEAALALERSRDHLLRLADLHFQNDAPDEAVQVWTSTLAADGTTAAEYVEIAMLMAARELLDDAEALLEQALDLEPDNGQTILNLAKLLARRGRFEQAVPYFTSLADQHEYPYLRERGIDGLLDAYSSLGLLQTKKNEWEQALADDPSSLPLLARLAEIELRLGNKRRVVRLYERCTELAPGDANYRLALARAYRTHEQPLLAIESYKQLIAQDDQRAARYYRELAALCAEEQQTEEAVAVAIEIVRRSPADGAALRNLARAYAANSDRAEALNTFRKLLQLKPGDADSLREYGDMLAGYNRFGEAQEAYRNLLAAATSERAEIEAVRLLASLYENHGHSEELIREFRARAEQSPDDPGAQEALAAVYTAAGDGDRAIEVLESALRFSANEEEGLRKLLRAAYEAGDLRKVVAVHHQLEAVRGDLTPRERERLGVAFAQLGAYRDAVDTWNVLYEERPENSETLQSLAQTMRNEGFSNRALKVTERALSVDPYNFTLRYQYAIRLAIAERSDSAIQELKTILELGDKTDDAAEGFVQFIANTNESVLGQQRQGLSKKPPLALLEGMGKVWQGSFNEFRRVVIFAMVHVAREMGMAERYTDEFRQAMDADPKSGRAKEDLLIAYQAGERWGAALDVARTLADAQPDNLWLLREIALMKQKSKRIETSIARQEQHMETYPESWIAASLSVLPLLYQEGEKEKADAIVATIVDQYGDAPRIMHPLASVMRAFGDAEDVIPLYERLIEFDPPNGGGTLFKLGRLYEHQGTYDQAQQIYDRLIFDERSLSVRSNSIQSRGSRFLPNGFHGIGELIHRFHWDVDVLRMRAFDALVHMKHDGTEQAAIINRVRAVVEGYDPAADSSTTRLSIDLGKILIAYFIQIDGFEEAQSMLNDMLSAGVRDLDLVGFRFFDDDPATFAATGS